jgi:hypothetical protein
LVEPLGGAEVRPHLFEQRIEHGQQPSIAIDNLASLTGRIPKIPTPVPFEAAARGRSW